MAGLLTGIKPELVQQPAFSLAVPMPAERREVIERVPHAHPRVKRHMIGHVGEARFDRNLMARRVESEHFDLPGSRPEQVQQTLDRGCLARSIAAEKTITTSVP